MKDEQGQLYDHFLLLHEAIRCLSYASPTSVQFRFAEKALRIFVLRSETLYGKGFVTYNTHGLLHLVDDAKNLNGPLDSFSAFPYENNMRIFRKYCRKPHLHLQQISKRRVEEINVLNRVGKIRSHAIQSFVACGLHNSGPIPDELSNASQYRQLKTPHFTLGLKLHNHCCVLQDDSVCVIKNIIAIRHVHYLIVQKFTKTEPFYDHGISSCSLGVYKCSELTTREYTIRSDLVIAKGYKMPYWPSTTSTDCDCNNISEEDIQPLSHEFVVFKMSEHFE